jgi:hypothetical protein
LVEQAEDGRRTAPTAHVDADTPTEGGGLQLHHYLTSVDAGLSEKARERAAKKAR